MAKKKKKYFELDEASLTTSIKGYLANKKQSCDPWAEANKKKTKKGETPWYLASMEELQESVKNELAVIKEGMGAADLMKGLAELQAKGINPDNYFVKNAIDMLRRANDPSLSSSKKAVYQKFADTLKHKYNNNLFDYVMDQVSKAKNVNFGELAKQNPELAKRVVNQLAQDFPKITGSGPVPRLKASFNKWELLPPEIRDEISQVAKQSNIKLNVHSNLKRSSERGKIRPKKSTRVGRAEKASPGDIEQNIKKPLGHSLSQIQGELEKEDPAIRPGTAARDLKKIYSDLVDEILYGKDGHFDDLVASKTKQNKVDLSKSLEKLLSLNDKIPDVGEIPEDVLNQFSKEEMAALLDLSQAADPEEQAKKAVLPQTYKGDRGEEFSSFERALRPFVKSHFQDKGFDTSEERDRDASSFVTDEAKRTFVAFLNNLNARKLERFSLQIGVEPEDLLAIKKQINSSEDPHKEAEEILSYIHNKSPKGFKRLKARILKNMSKLGFGDAVEREKEMDSARATTRGSDLPTRYKIFKEPEAFSSDEDFEKKMNMFDRAIKRKKEFSKDPEQQPRDPESLEKRTQHADPSVFKKKEKPEPKVYYGSEKAKEKHLKGPSLKKMFSKGDDGLPTALKKVSSRKQKEKQRPRKKVDPFAKSISKEPTEKRKATQKNRVRTPIGKPQSNILPPNLSWGQLPFHVQQALLKRFKTQGSSVSPDWSRFNKLSPGIQKWIASKMGFNESFEPEINLESLFNIDGSETCETPKKKEWENAKLANKVDFLPKDNEE